MFFVFMLLVKAQIYTMPHDDLFKSVCLAILTISTFGVPFVIVMRRLRWSVSSDEEAAEEEADAAAEEEAARLEAEERAAEAVLAQTSGSPRSFRAFTALSLKNLTGRGGSIASHWWRAEPEEHPSLQST